MTREWVNERIRLENQKREELEKALIKTVKESKLDDIYKEDILRVISKKRYEYAEFSMRLYFGEIYDDLEYKKKIKESRIEELLMCTSDEYLKNLEDSDEKFFSGDIIITDPCYLMKKRNDWYLCGLGDHMYKLGFKNYKVRDTIYGDWSCTTYNSDTKEVIGHFCADAGLVGVFLLNEVLKYNPGFDYHINNKHTTTLIKDFEGTVRFTVTEEFYEYNKNEQCTEYVVRVIGHGKNKITGKPINFITIQIGL